MAKNLKINVKNAQLAQAINLGRVKKPGTSKKKEEVVEPTVDKVAPVPVAEEAKEPAAKPPVIASPPPQKSVEDRVVSPSVPPREEAAYRENTSPAREENRPVVPPKGPAPVEPHNRQVERGTPSREGPSSSQPYRRYSDSSPQRRDERPYSSYPPRREGGPSSSNYPPRRDGGYPSSHYQQRREGTPPPHYQQRREGAPSSPHYRSSPYPQREGFAPRRPPSSSYPSQRPPFTRPGETRYEPRRPPLAPKEPPRNEKGGRVFEKEDSSRETRKHLPQKEAPKDTKSRKPEDRGFDSRDRLGLRDQLEEQGWRKKRPSHKIRATQQEEIIRPKSLKLRLPITVKDLASEMKLKASQLISKLFMKGVVLTLNDYLDDETTIQLLGHDFGCEISIDTAEEERLRITDKTIKQEIQEASPGSLVYRPPVVAFMGHVDHGKTSLIDAIRKSKIAAGEAGAITQHIGAFKCHTTSGDITILDTPGHEAFSAMRARGADVTDIVVLVIAGDEGIRAQTTEAIEQAQAANVPIIVAINKCDKPSFNAENIYRQLADNNLLPEAWGGQTITVNCSALNGTGLKELLEMLALQTEILELKANPNQRARGTVIESEMHKGMGPVATLLVQNGTLRIGDAIVFAQNYARVKTMQDEFSRELTSAEPSTPVKITGLSGLPAAGSEFIVVKSEKEAMEIAEKRSEGTRHQLHTQVKRAGMESFLAEKSTGINKKFLPLILRADVQGSVEALKTSLLKITSNKVELVIISAAVGEISESDVQLAYASKATILGFHTQIESHAASLIKELKVPIKLHDIIYHAVDDVRETMLSLLDKISKEVDVGAAEVRMVFKASQLGMIAGCMVTEGTIKRSSHIRQVRDNRVIWKGAISSLKRVKEDIREVSKGHECGILLQGNNDVKGGDILQAFDIIYLEQEL